MDGANSTQGRVEVCRTNAWGTVCDDFWDDTDASVACRQLGFADQGAIARGSAFFGQGTGPINLDDLECNGSEERLIDCTFDPTHNCGHGEDAGVECVGMSAPLWYVYMYDFFVVWERLSTACHLFVTVGSFSIIMRKLRILTTPNTLINRHGSRSTIVSCTQDF